MAHSRSSCICALFYLFHGRVEVLVAKCVSTGEGERCIRGTTRSVIYSVHLLNCRYNVSWHQTVGNAYVSYYWKLIYGFHKSCCKGALMSQTDISDVACENFEWISASPQDGIAQVVFSHWNNGGFLTREMTSFSLELEESDFLNLSAVYLSGVRLTSLCGQICTTRTLCFRSFHSLQAGFRLLRNQCDCSLSQGHLLFQFQLTSFHPELAAGLCVSINSVLAS